MIYFLSFFIFIYSHLYSNPIITYLAENHVHSFCDDHLPYEEAKEIIKIRPLKMSCGAFSYFSMRYLKERGIKCRFILTLTLDEWDDRNNGHSMIEIYEKGKWTLWDIDLKNIFVFKGKHLNAKKFCRLSQNGNYEIVKFCPGNIVDDENSWYGKAFSTEKSFRKFYKRCCQILMVENEGIFYFTSEFKDIARILSYPYTGPFSYMKKKEFTKTFY